MKPIKVGRYRLRNGRKAIVRIVDTINDVSVARGGICDAEVEHPAEWTADDGLCGNEPGPWDLVERLPDAPKELPPALNSAVKAAEDRVRDLKKHHGAAQDVAEEARRMWEEAKRELERMEKECEVGK